MSQKDAQFIERLVKMKEAAGNRLDLVIFVSRSIVFRFVDFTVIGDGWIHLDLKEGHERGTLRGVDVNVSEIAYMCEPDY
jgi:hypothetical protein